MLMSNISFEHISLGPSCIPAEMLKAANLRSCTYGFDWFRSGGFFVQQFISLDLDTFLCRYVFNPSIPLIQIGANSSINTDASTLEVSPIDPIYGFTYLYNPHRNYLYPSTFEYFSRAFGRLKNVISSSNKLKKFIIADYTNKPHYTHINNPYKVREYLEKCFGEFGIDNYQLHIIRLSLSNSITYLDQQPFIHLKEHTSNFYLHNFKICTGIDDCLWMRRKLYKHIINSALA